MIGKTLAGSLLALSLLFAGAACADERADRVDALVKRQMEARRIPGLQVAVIKDGKVVLSRAYGVANLQTPVPVTTETVFSINSITKAFTGVAAMREVEAGRLDLAKPVSAYVADLPDAWRGVTMRQLLSHMSGLPDFTRTKLPPEDEAGAWKAALAMPVRFAPGERFDYDQTNYALVQKAINGLNGRPPAAILIGDQIALAGMSRTGSGDSRDVVPGKAAGYRFTLADQAGAGEMKSVYEIFTPLHRAASGMNSTAQDMAQWLIALQQGKLLGEEARRTMWTRSVFNSGQPGQWGIGWVVYDRPGHRAVGMTGGSRAAMILYPDDGVGVVILTNLSGSAPEDFIDEVGAVYVPGMKLQGVAALRARLEAEGYDRLPAVLADLRRQDPGFRLDEHELNDWAYRVMSFGRPRDALPLFRLNAELYPASGNVFDSLGEAYKVNGDRGQAVANYRRSLALDPSNDNARRQLESLGATAG